MESQNPAKEPRMAPPPFSGLELPEGVDDRAGVVETVPEKVLRIHQSSGRPSPLVSVASGAVARVRVVEVVVERGDPEEGLAKWDDHRRLGLPHRGPEPVKGTPQAPDAHIRGPAARRKCGSVVTWRPLPAAELHDHPADQ
jgi:hypothetical protein